MNCLSNFLDNVIERIGYEPWDFKNSARNKVKEWHEVSISTILGEAYYSFWWLDTDEGDDYWFDIYTCALREENDRKILN